MICKLLACAASEARVLRNIAAKIEYLGCPSSCVAVLTILGRIGQILDGIGC